MSNCPISQDYTPSLCATTVHRMSNYPISQDSDPLTDSIIATGRRDYSIDLYKDAFSFTHVPLHCQETRPFHRQEMVPGIGVRNVHRSHNTTRKHIGQISLKTEYSTCRVTLDRCVVSVSWRWRETKPEKSLSITSGVLDRGVHTVRLEGL